MTATTKWFNTQKGYGFITDLSSKKDVFVHQSNIMMDGFRHLSEGDIVNYELGDGKNGREQAVNVQPILTMQMIKDSLKDENLFVKTVKADENTLALNTLGMKKGYMVVDENDVIQAGENGMTFLDLAAYAGYDTEGLSV